MVAVDIASFSSRRDPAVQRYLRDSVHRIVRDACRAAGLDWDACHHEDRGDGLFVIAGAETAIDDLLGPLAVQLLTGVRRHNRLANGEAQIRLRAAVHAGYLHLDDHGATGLALIHLFRLLDAAPLKHMLAEGTGDFALIVSHHLFEEVVAYSVGVVEPSAFRCIPVKVKETHDRGWVWLPPGPGGVPFMPDVAGTDVAGTGSGARLAGSDERLLGLLAALVQQLERLAR